jgi:hypothetical protein
MSDELEFVDVRTDTNLRYYEPLPQATTNFKFFGHPGINTYCRPYKSSSRNSFLATLRH